jgi:endonuclease YncB( thermonuclease family)
VDLGEWLVEQGWAEAVPGSPLERFAETARRLRRGIHSGG